MKKSDIIYLDFIFDFTTTDKFHRGVKTFYIMLDFILLYSYDAIPCVSEEVLIKWNNCIRFISKVGDQYLLQASFVAHLQAAGGEIT